MGLFCVGLLSYSALKFCYDYQYNYNNQCIWIHSNVTDTLIETDIQNLAYLKNGNKIMPNAVFYDEFSCVNFSLRYVDLNLFSAIAKFEDHTHEGFTHID